MLKLKTTDRTIVGGVAGRRLSDNDFGKDEKHSQLLFIKTVPTHIRRVLQRKTCEICFFRWYYQANSLGIWQTIREEEEFHENRWDCLESQELFQESAPGEASIQGPPSILCGLQSWKQRTGSDPLWATASHRFVLFCAEIGTFCVTCRLLKTKRLHD